MHIIIDHSKCTGHGLCEAEAPEVFQVQDDGSLRLLTEYPTESERAGVEAAVEACPTQALRIVED